MGVMLPGAVELPHDKIIFQIEKLEDENKVLTDANISLLKEVEHLKERIAELEASK